MSDPIFMIPVTEAQLAVLRSCTAKAAPIDRKKPINIFTLGTLLDQVKADGPVKPEDTTSAAFTFTAFNRPMTDEDMADALEHLAGMIRDGFTSGDMNGAGWWSVSNLSDAEDDDATGWTGEDVPELRLERGNIAVTLEYIGEGNDGDYDPDDAGDEPLMRVGVQRLEDGKWDEVEDSSYCTQISARGSEAGKGLALEYIIAQLPQTGSVKKIMERMSWIELTTQDGDSPDFSRVPA